uniref:Uncharacterized protein n=2 Tax=Oryza sativa subsp. japonica TaxID=39947 RepID=Q5W6K1_ORYSJ|nr:hypothetical protein [Oryza sativa Japonica Group]ABF97375.1 hypothetical protein LOC_Os03g39200 [Oryza sativa Japonica Group]
MASSRLPPHRRLVEVLPGDLSEEIVEETQRWIKSAGTPLTHSSLALDLHWS